MKKKTVKKLELAKETVRILANPELAGKVNGGDANSAINFTCPSCECHQH